MRCGPTRFAA